MSEGRERGGEVHPLRPATRDLLRALDRGKWPGREAVRDFGLHTNEHYLAISRAYGRSDLAPAELDAVWRDALGLTRLVNSKACNAFEAIPYFVTPSDLRGGAPVAWLEPRREVYLHPWEAPAWEWPYGRGGYEELSRALEAAERHRGRVMSDAHLENGLMPQEPALYSDGRCAVSDDRDLVAADSNLRPVTQTLVYALVVGVWPEGAVIVDFGLVSAEHYEAVFHAFRHGDVTKADLDAALGDGPKLTELMRNAPHNPHRDKNLVFATPWDELEPEYRIRRPESEVRQPAKVFDFARERAKRNRDRDHEPER